MAEDIIYFDPRGIREMCRKYGFSRDARELSGFRMDRVAELLVEGFDLMAESHRRKDGSLSIKVMKKSHDPDGGLFVYARMPSFRENPPYYQFGFFRNTEEIRFALGIGGNLELGEFEEAWRVLDYAKAEIDHYDLLARFSDN